MPLTSPPSTKREDDHLQRRVLESLRSARRYNAWLASLVAPHLGDHPIEIGSGLGDHAAAWLKEGAPRITVSDFEPTFADALRARFESDARIDVLAVDITDPPSGAHSALVALNVLEHIADDVAALRGARALVRPGGTIVLFVPAFEFAMSRFDREIGHFRRYSAMTLARAIEQAGLTVERLHYVNAPGLLAWIVGMKLLRLEPREGPLLRTWDRVVVPVARRLESWRPPPFGQSLFAVARVPAGTG